MARKSQYRLGEKAAELTEMLDSVEQLLERTKVLYEQYFMGIQKMAPAQLHRDVERKIRELTQIQIRNTALRYRLTTITQKFGVYNSYWRRTMRQVEQGTYVRDVARASRRAQRRGEDVPDELLLSMPKRMRDRILRDRELLARRTAEGSGAEAIAAGDDDDEADTGVLERKAAPAPRSHVHQLDAGMLDDDLGVDIDELFRSLTSEAEKAVEAHTRPAAATPAARPTVTAAPAATPAATAARPAATAARPAATAARPAATAARPAVTPPPVPVRARPAAPPPIPGRAAPAPAGIKPAAPPPRVQPAASAPVARPQPPAQASALPPGMTEEKARDLHRRYVQARRQVGDAAEVPYEALVQSLRNQAPRIMQQHKASSVDFDVVVKNDKVLLKAKPRP